jgi:hypothetical protein
MAARLEPGAAVGPYRLLEELGSGGLGRVFVAEQFEPIRRRVALKVIKPGDQAGNGLAGDPGAVLGRTASDRRRPPYGR